jgi:hypothetical protein
MNIGNPVTVYNAVNDKRSNLRVAKVASVGKGTVDVRVVGSMTTRYDVPLAGGGTPAKGSTVYLKKEGNQWFAYASQGGVGVTQYVSGSVGNTSLPLQHARTHAVGGTDYLSPSAIGAATPSDITTAISTHLADTDPHTQYANETRFGEWFAGQQHNSLLGLTTGDPHTQYLTPGRGDERYLKLSGGTLAGALSAPGFFPTEPDTYDLGSDENRFRSLHVASIDMTLFKEETAQLFGGYLIVPKGTGSLAADTSLATATFPGQPWVPSGQTEPVMDFGQSMTVGDIVLMRGKDSSGSFRSEFVRVGDVISGTVYQITHDLMGAGTASAWSSGTPYAILGRDDDGWIELQSYDTPRFSVFTLDNASGTPTISERIRIGDLNGWDTAGTTRYGIGIGDYAAGNYLRYEPTDGLIVKGGDGNVSIDPSGIAVSTITSSDYHKAAYMFGSPSDPVGYMQYYIDEVASGYPAFLQIFQKNSSVGGIWLRSYSPNASTSTYDDEASLVISPDGSITLGGPYYRSGIGAAYAWNSYYAKFTFDSTTIKGTLNVQDGSEYYTSSGRSSSGGINVGTATGAGTGQIKASGNVFASGLNLGTAIDAAAGELKASGSGSFAGGVNIGTASGAGTGQIKASGDVFAAGKNTGVQAQILDNHVFYITQAIGLTTSWQVITGLSTSHTPATNEIAEVTILLSIAQHAGAAACQNNDQLVGAFSLYYDSADHYSDSKGSWATGGIGTVCILIKAYALLTSGKTYTIRAVAKNATGARGLVDWASWMDVKYRAA